MVASNPFLKVNNNNRFVISRRFVKGKVARLTRGVYIAADVLDGMSPAERHRARAQAFLEAHEGVVPFGVTAALLLGADAAEVPETLHFAAAPGAGRKTTREKGVRLHRGVAASLSDDPDAAIVLQVALSEPPAAAVPVINDMLRRGMPQSDMWRDRVFAPEALAGGPLRDWLNKTAAKRLLHTLETASGGSEAERAAAVERVLAYRQYGFNTVGADEAIRAALEALGRMKRAHGRERALLSLLLATDTAESAAESLFGVKCFALGYRSPAVQLNLLWKDGGGAEAAAARVDGVWALTEAAQAAMREQLSFRAAGSRKDRALELSPALARDLLIFEFDGRSKFFELDEEREGGTERALYEAHRRQDMLTNRGCRFLRVVWKELMDDAQLSEILRAAGVPRRR
ncbi:MAG: hypothetical protein LBR44_06600 [Clostridiales Family XIII bacterium]|jgi:hypothetical protein|nr:hypothetical protein [Clostridiales Family XIII bacterium]